MLEHGQTARRAALTPRQKRFVAEYLIDLNAKQAAIRAGYAKSGAAVEGFRLLVNPKVAVGVAAAQAKRSERTEITQDYVLASIMATMERCKQAKAVTDQDGAEAGEWTFNASAVLKGAELLGRHLAMFTHKKTVTHIDGDRLDAMVEHITDNGKYIGQSRRDH